MIYLMILTLVNWSNIMYLVYIKLTELTRAKYLYVQNRINNQLIQEQDLVEANLIFVTLTKHLLISSLAASMIIIELFPLFFKLSISELYIPIFFIVANLFPFKLLFWMIDFNLRNYTLLRKILNLSQVVIFFAGFILIYWYFHRG